MQFFHVLVETDFSLAYSYTCILLMFKASEYILVESNGELVILTLAKKKNES